MIISRMMAKTIMLANQFLAPDKEADLVSALTNQPIPKPQKPPVPNNTIINDIKPSISG
jgi:hypothetical protein